MLNLVIFLDRMVKKTLTAFCAILLFMMVVFTVYTVVMRYVFEDPPVWGDLLTVLSNIWLVFVFKPNYIPKKYAIAIVPISGFLVSIAAISSIIQDTVKLRAGTYHQIVDLEIQTENSQT